MSETVETTDLGVGLGMFFGVVALAGAIGMYVAHANQIVAGASFGVAMAAGALAIAAIHLHG